VRTRPSPKGFFCLLSSLAPSSLLMLSSSLLPLTSLSLLSSSSAYGEKEAKTEERVTMLGHGKNMKKRREPSTHGLSESRAFATLLSRRLRDSKKQALLEGTATWQLLITLIPLYSGILLLALRPHLKPHLRSHLQFTPEVSGSGRSSRAI